EYKIEIPVPGTPDPLRGKFIVKDSNPELDMVRPDFAAMFQIASEMKDLKTPLDRPTEDKIRTVLLGRRIKVADKPAPAAGGEQPIDVETPSESPRLYFDLKSAGLITDCLPTAEPKREGNRGKVDDLWDDGPTV